MINDYGSGGDKDRKRNRLKCNSKCLQILLWIWCLDIGWYYSVYSPTICFWNKFYNKLTHPLFLEQNFIYNLICTMFNKFLFCFQWLKLQLLNIVLNKQVIYDESSYCPSRKTIKVNHNLETIKFTYCKFTWNDYQKAGIFHSLYDHRKTIEVFIMFI